MAARLPDDPAIPLLDAISRQGWDHVLAGLGIRDGAVQVTLLAHTVGSRCSFNVQTPGARLLVKGYAEDPHELVDLLNGLEREGLASGKGPTVPPLMGASGALRCLVTAWLEGPSAWDLIRNANGKRAGLLAGAWLRRTAALPLTIGRPYTSRAALLEARAWVTRISSADGELAAKASACFDRLNAALPADGRMAVRHGSFVPRHVLDLADGPGIIDWDSFRLADLELDAGLFLAACSRMGTRSGLGQAAAQAAEALRDALHGSVDPARLRWYQAAGMLRLSAYLAGRQPADWRARSAVLLDGTVALLA